jgi:glycosyltransferase involved in cell wall biosynthesis
VRPELTAILCTYQRAELLRRALSAARAQTLDPARFEVVVVDDGSTDATREVARAFKGSLPLRYVVQANAGLAAAKNHGLAVARGAIVVFLDDDDVLAPDALEAHLRAHRERPDPATAVLGHTGLAPDVARSPLMRFVTEVGCQLFFYPSIRPGDRLDFTYFWGGRSSCKRALLMEHGVFDPVFRFGCEDIELGFRLAKKTGFHVVYDDRARSTMVRALDYEGFCRRSYLQGRSNRVFATRHPDEVVRRWAQVEAVDDEWRAIAPRHDEVLKVGRDLDRLANERLAAGRPLDALTTTLLHRAYWAAFRASRVKGSFDAR